MTEARPNLGGMEIGDGSRHRWRRVLGPLRSEVLAFATALGGRRPDALRLFVIGDADHEPWHFTAHLRDDTQRAGRADLAPTLLRWQVPPGAPPHLAWSVDAAASASRRDTLLVITPGAPAAEMLERVADANRRGARILSIHRSHDEVAGLSHEVLSVDPDRPAATFEVAQHVVSAVAPSAAQPLPRRRLLVRR